MKIDIQRTHIRDHASRLYLNFFYLFLEVSHLDSDVYIIFRVVFRLQNNISNYLSVCVHLFIFEKKTCV